MPDYDAQRHDPPAPVARVVLRTFDHAQSIADVAMLIDSGADVSLVPASCAEELGLDVELETDLALQGFDGNTSLGRSARAEVLLLGRVFRGRFLVIDQPTGVLGRNVLNHVALTLDGPRLQWRLEAS